MTVNIQDSFGDGDGSSKESYCICDKVTRMHARSGRGREMSRETVEAFVLIGVIIDTAAWHCEIASRTYLSYPG